MKVTSLFVIVSSLSSFYCCNAEYNSAKKVIINDNDNHRILQDATRPPNPTFHHSLLHRHQLPLASLVNPNLANPLPALHPNLVRVRQAEVVVVVRQVVDPVDVASHPSQAALCQEAHAVASIVQAAQVARRALAVNGLRPQVEVSVLMPRRLKTAQFNLN